MAKLVPVQDLQPAFNNAIAYLNREMRQNEIVSMGQLANRFKEEFDCYVMWDQTWTWDVVGFKNDEQHMMFVLKWS